MEMFCVAAVIKLVYEGGYLRNPLRGGSLNWIVRRFVSTGPFLMFLDVLESREHACYKKYNFVKNIENQQKVTADTTFLHTDFFRSGTQRVKDSLIRAYHTSHDFQLKFIDFPLFLKTTSKRYPLPRNAWDSPSALNSFLEV